MNYLLAEPQQQIIKKAYSGKFTQPQISYLFDETEMPELKETGPVLLHDPNADEQTLKQLLQTHSGLYITSNYSKEDVLAQLRHNLFVYFKPDQIGIFRYYDPYIASYFLTSLSDQEIADWLGPIQSIQWYNANWRDKVNQPDHWQTLVNPAAKEWQKNPERLKTKPVLTNNQNLALQDMQEEKFAYHWQQDPSQNPNQIDIDRTIHWVKQGIREGFTSERHLNQYLSIRAEQPKGKLPESWPTSDIAEKLTYLKYYLAQTSAS